MINIETISPIESKISRPHAGLISPCISWPAEYWKKKKGGFGRERVEYIANAFHQAKGGFFFFYNGLLPRILDYCEEKEFEVEIKNNISLEMTSRRPYLPPDEEFKDFRNDQYKLIQRARRMKKGLIKGPTGIGKTILQLGIMSSFPEARVLLLAHTISIVDQTAKQMKRFGIEFQSIGGSNTDKNLKNKIIISTRQSFSKIPVENFRDKFDIVIVDEAHHISKISSEYGNILGNLYAPLRFGFTGTVPKEKAKRFAIEALIGPIIGEMSLHEGINLGLLAEPQIFLLKSNYNPRIRALHRYPEVYEQGITENRNRNALIANIAKREVDKGGKVLILVFSLNHGENLYYELEREKIITKFIRGITPDTVREETRAALHEGDISCVIASAVWREGIDIPSLTMVVNACGGKSEILTLQSIGRGLRKYKGKEVVKIVDIFDPSHYYLISHFGHRITLYMDQGWKFISEI